MKLYVGITDYDWYSQLSQQKPDEVNFWKPGEKGGFGVLDPGELFLFKLHAPRNFIVGGAYFVKYSLLPASLAWLAFGEKNGVRSLTQLVQRVHHYRSKPGETANVADPFIGCIVLTEPFWFEPDEWIPAPADWPKSTVQGKSYDALDSRGYELWAQVRARLGLRIVHSSISESFNRYAKRELNVRLGQGAFQVLVTDAYSRRCAITGETTLPVLEAAHIKPFSESGPHLTRNGLLLRSDMHILFDKGLLTVTPEHRIEVSSMIQEQYTNGKLYYSYHGQELRSVPRELMDQPADEFLSWHNQNVFSR